MAASRNHHDLFLELEFGLLFLCTTLPGGRHVTSVDVEAVRTLCARGDTSSPCETVIATPTTPFTDHRNFFSDLIYYRAADMNIVMFILYIF